MNVSYTVKKLLLPKELIYIVLSYLPNIHVELLERTNTGFWFSNITINDRYLFYESHHSLGGDRRTIGKSNINNLRKLFQLEKDLLRNLSKRTIQKIHDRNIEICEHRNIFTVFKLKTFQDILPLTM
jgi:hypothetical protein